MQKTVINATRLLPRLIRLKDAPAYLGMDKNRFNKEVRPSVLVIRMGIQGIAFDRLELDTWAEHYKQDHGVPEIANAGNIELWDAKYRRASLNGERSGTLKKEYSDKDFERALVLSRSPKRNAT